MQDVLSDDEGTNKEGTIEGTGKDEELGETDIPTRFKALVKQLCDERLTDTEAVEGPVTAWRLKHFRGIDNPHVLALFNDALPDVLARLAELENSRRGAQKRTVFWTVALTFCDTVSDFGSCYVLLDAGSSYGIPMLVVMLSSMIMQAVGARYLTKEGSLATVGALFGLKPIIDGINICFDIPPAPGALNSLMAFGYTRSIEAAIESIPFAVIQSLALMEQRSTTQWLSIAITLANAAHAVASVDHQFDTRKKARTSEPTLWGMYPPGPKGDALFVSFAIFALSYAVAKLLAVAALGTVSPASLALVVVGESAALFSVRFAIGNWRWFSRAGDSDVVSVLWHFFAVYPAANAAPFAWARHPFILTPSVWSGWFIWALFIANPLMLVFALHHDVPLFISPRRLWIALGVATAVCAFSLILAFQLMVPAFRDTFYRHRTLSTYIRDSQWTRSTKLDGSRIESNDDLDVVRARTLKTYAKAYWPMDLARVWVRKGWARWLSNPPTWFTKKWRARVPEEWFDGGDGDGSSVVVPMTTQEANFRHAVDQTPPWNLNTRDLETYFADHFVNSSSLSLAESEMKKRRHLVHLVAGAGGVGLLERCCTSDTKAPWVRISNDAAGKPLRVDEECLKQLSSFLCSKGLSFYYRLYVASVSISPLQEYTLVKPLEQHENLEHMLCRNRQTKHPAILSFASSTHYPVTRDTITGIQSVCETSEFVASINQWGPIDPVVFIVGEHCGGGPLTARIKPDIGIEDSKEFWRLALQLAQGLSDIHRAGLVHASIQVRCRACFLNKNVSNSDCFMLCSLHSPKMRCSQKQVMFAMATLA